MRQKISLGNDLNTEEKKDGEKNGESIKDKHFIPKSGKVYKEVDAFDKEESDAEMAKIKMVLDAMESLTERVLSSTEKLASKNQDFLLAVLEKSPESFSKALDFQQAMGVATVQGMFVEPTKIIMEKIEKLDLVKLAEAMAKKKS